MASTARRESVDHYESLSQGKRSPRSQRSTHITRVILYCLAGMGCYLIGELRGATNGATLSAFQDKVVSFTEAVPRSVGTEGLGTEVEFKEDTETEEDSIKLPTKPVGKSENEKYYDEQYRKWQLSKNKFGAMYKKRYWRDYVNPDSKCVEFGCSSGYILQSMECGEKIGVDINDAARAYAKNELGLTVVPRTADIPDASQDFVFSSSVLEHVECPVCEIRELYRILKPGGVLSITAPGQAPRSRQWKRNDVNFEFQMFGGLEMGNLLTAAGFAIRDPSQCFSEVTQWPPEASEKLRSMGLDAFVEYAKSYGHRHAKLVTTWCVGHKD